MTKNYVPIVKADGAASNLPVKYTGSFLSSFNQQLLSSFSFLKETG